MYRRPALVLVLLVSLSAVSGCDAVFPDPSYAGVVVDAETGAPLEGIHVSFQTNGSFGQYSVVASVLTDADGRFWLRNPSEGRAALNVNNPRGGFGGPSLRDPRYDGGLVLGFDDRHDIRVELRRLPCGAPCSATP